MAKQEKYTEEVKTIVNLAKEKNIKIVNVEAGKTIKLDSRTYIDILYIGNDMENLNNNSIITKLRYNSFSMLFTGDAEKEEEVELLKLNKNIRANVIKVGHHGSQTSSSQEFIEKVNPQIALIGVGKKNNFGHPNAEVVRRLIDLRYKDLQNRLMR